MNSTTIILAIICLAVCAVGVWDARRRNKPMPKELDGLLTTIEAAENEGMPQFNTDRGE